MSEIQSCLHFVVLILSDSCMTRDFDKLSQSYHAHERHRCVCYMVIGKFPVPSPGALF